MFAQPIKEHASTAPLNLQTDHQPYIQLPCGQSVAFGAFFYPVFVIFYMFTVSMQQQ